MDYLKSQFDRIQRQLTGLSASHKMLSGALVVIMVMTLMMWGRYAGESEMVPLLDQSFAHDDLSRIVVELESRNIRYGMEGSRVLVPADRQIEALAHLSYQQLLPRNIAPGFDDVIKQLKPWDLQSKADMLFNRGKENALAAIIGAFPGVKNAAVVIDPNSKRRIGGGDTHPSATIIIWMRGGAPASQHLVNAAADVVAGAQAGLEVGRIKLSVDGKPRRIQGADGEGLDGDEALALIKQHEERLENKIREHLSFIPNLMVTVAVDIDIEKKESQSQVFDNDNTVVRELEVSKKTRQVTEGAPPADEPGGIASTGTAAANTEMDVASAQVGSSTESETQIKNQVKVGSKLEKISTPAGDAKSASASIRVPRSYFVNILRGGNPDAKEPDEAALDSLIRRELPKIRHAVMFTAQLKEESVSVDTYHDALPLQMAGAPEAVTTTAASLLLAGHSKEIALGSLAAISLFMVSMMVRKGAPAPAMTMPLMPPEGVALTEFDSTSADRGGSEGIDEMDLDEEAVHNQQMLDQVSTLVTENPDAAAALVQRWMNRS